MFVSFCGYDKLQLTTCHVLNAGNITAVSYPPDIVSLVEICHKFIYICFVKIKLFNKIMFWIVAKKSYKILLDLNA